MERRLLQLALAVASLVPISAGLGMVIYGPDFLDLTATISADSHLRYLSGLLLGTGLMVWTVIPDVEKKEAVLRTVMLIVAIGGFARLWSLVHVGRPNVAMELALVMELGVTPALYLWQRRVARRS